MGCVYCVWWYKSPTPWYKTLRYLWLIDWLIDWLIWFDLKRCGTLRYVTNDTTRLRLPDIELRDIDYLVGWLIYWFIDWLLIDCIALHCARYNGIQLRDIELRDIDYLVDWLIDWLGMRVLCMMEYISNSQI